MGFLDAAYYFGSPIGSALTGPLLDAGGYLAAYTFVIAVYAVSIVYVILRLRSKVDQQQEVCESVEMWETAKGA